MKKEFDILNHISEYEILEKLKYLGSKELTITGHGYKTFSNIPILESAQKSTLNYSNRSSVKPAIALIDVILAANRNYNKVVEPNINRIQEKYPDLKNFDELNKIINSQTKQEFYLFWGHKDEKKYNT